MNPVTIITPLQISPKANGAFQAFTFALNFNGSIKLKAHDAFFVFSPSTCRPLRMEVVERQQGRKLRNAHLRRSANYELQSRGGRRGQSQGLMPRGPQIFFQVAFAPAALLLLFNFSLKP